MNYNYISNRYAQAFRTPYYFVLSGELLELYNQSASFIRSWLELPVVEYENEVCVLRDKNVEQHFDLLRRAMKAEASSKKLPPKSEGVRLGRRNLSLMKDVLPPTGLNDYSYYSGARNWITFDNQRDLTEYYPHLNDGAIFVCTNPPRIKSEKLHYGRFTPYMLSGLVENET